MEAVPGGLQWAGPVEAGLWVSAFLLLNPDSLGIRANKLLSRLCRCALYLHRLRAQGAKLLLFALSQAALLGALYGSPAAGA